PPAACDGGIASRRPETFSSRCRPSRHARREFFWPCSILRQPARAGVAICENLDADGLVGMGGQVDRSASISFPYPDAMPGNLYTKPSRFRVVDSTQLD